MPKNLLFWIEMYSDFLLFCCRTHHLNYDVAAQIKAAHLLLTWRRLHNHLKKTKVHKFGLFLIGIDSDYLVLYNFYVCYVTPTLNLLHNRQNYHNYPPKTHGYQLNNSFHAYMYPQNDKNFAKIPLNLTLKYSSFFYFLLPSHS